MIENICHACHTVLKDDSANCPVCHMPRYMVIGENDEAKKMILQIADEHRKNMLKDRTIYILAHEYAYAEGKLKIKTSHKIKVADAKELTFDKTVWFSEKFARVDRDRNMELSVMVESLQGEEKEYDLSFTSPKIEDFWRLGVKLMPGLEAVFQIGNESRYVQTEGISLI